MNFGGNAGICTRGYTLIWSYWGYKARPALRRFRRLEFRSGGYSLQRMEGISHASIVGRVDQLGQSLQALR